MVMKLFKKKSKTPPGNGMEKKDEVIYSMTPRHGHAQDVFDENGIRQVAGCLPIDPINKRFLLVSSSSDPTVWVIPKGGWEKDETQKQAAMRETWEEAGVKGIITRHIGVFAEKTRGGVKAHHWIYEMEIKEVCKKFPEQKKRERRWFTYDEAMLVVKAHYIHDALSMSSLSPLAHTDGDESGEKKKKKKKKDKEKKAKAEGEDNDDDNNNNDVDEDGEKKKKKKKKNKDKENAENEEDGEDDDNELTAEEKKDKKEKEKKKKKKKNKNKDDEDDYVSEEEDVKEVIENELNSDGKIVKGNAVTEVTPSLEKLNIGGVDKPGLSDERYQPMPSNRYQQQAIQQQQPQQHSSPPLSKPTQQGQIGPPNRYPQQVPPNYHPQTQQLQQQHRPPRPNMYQQHPSAIAYNQQPNMHPSRPPQQQHPSYQTPPTQWQQYPPQQHQQFRPMNGSPHLRPLGQQPQVQHPGIPQQHHPGMTNGAAARGGQPPHIITNPHQQQPKQPTDRGKILMEIGKDSSGLIPQRN